MKAATEILFTIIIIIGIIYTAVPFFISVYCFAMPPHTHNRDAFVTDKVVVNGETEEINNQLIPEYANTSYQPKTIAQLQTALSVCDPPQPHSQSYDCSELSAYTEYYLENSGFNTTISASFTEGHAWCTLYDIIGYDIVHVECIPPAHISNSLGPIEQSYDNIQEALAGNYPYEWDWWSP